MIAGMVIFQIALEWSQPWEQILSDTVGDVAELLIAVYWLPPLNGVSKWIREPGLLKRFILWAAVLDPAITAFPAAAGYASDLQVSYWSYWTRRFTGDMIGIVLWLPLRHRLGRLLEHRPEARDSAGVADRDRRSGPLFGQPRWSEPHLHDLRGGGATRRPRKLIRLPSARSEREP
jgi:hypothetical protein